MVKHENYSKPERKEKDYNQKYSNSYSSKNRDRDYRDSKDNRDNRDNRDYTNNLNKIYSERDRERDRERYSKTNKNKQKSTNPKYGRYGIIK